MKKRLLLFGLLLMAVVSSFAQSVLPMNQVTDTTGFASLSATDRLVAFDGSLWERRAGSVAPNGGTIFAASSGYYYARRYSGPVNVRWFGAKGDGVTNDSQAIQKALNVANDSAKTLFIPAGTYKIGTRVAVTIKSITETSGIIRKLSIEGENVSNTVLLYNAAADTTALEITGNGNDLLSLKNLQIRRTAGSGLSTGLRLNTMSQIHLTNIQIMGFRTGCTIRGVNTALFEFMSLAWNQKGLDAKDSDTPFSHPNLFLFESCSFNSNINTAVRIYVGVTNTFSNCDFSHNGSSISSNTVEVLYRHNNGSVPVAFNDCYFEANQGTDINLYSGNDSQSGVVTIRGCTFNKVDNSKFVTNHVKCLNESGKQFRILLIGNGTNIGGTYTAASGRPFISLNVTNNSSYYIEDSNAYFDPMEGPVYNFDRDEINNEKTKLFAKARISSTGSLMTGYNISSVTRLAVGQYQINFKRPTNGFCYPLITGIQAPIFGYVFREDSNYSTVVLKDANGVDTDALFQVIFFAN
ncbi:MAG: hypothetical protein J7576_08655 [Siphonobacter aquaeclarae]|nr:hypothetical protein [Siphonobacter aquaeclarae]